MGWKINLNGILFEAFFYRRERGEGAENAERKSLLLSPLFIGPIGISVYWSIKAILTQAL